MDSLTDNSHPYFKCPTCETPLERRWTDSEGGFTYQNCYCKKCGKETSKNISERNCHSRYKNDLGKFIWCDYNLFSADNLHAIRCPKCNSIMPCELNCSYCNSEDYY